MGQRFKVFFGENDPWGFNKPSEEDRLWRVSKYQKVKGKYHEVLGRNE